MNIPFVENGLATRRSYAEKNSEQVKRFIKASFERIRRMFDNKDLTMKIIAKYTKITHEKMLEEVIALRWMRSARTLPCHMMRWRHW
jgi:ABC-type nitrate/sulfonate/bicarbonate transport system substrate-binding protein